MERNRLFALVFIAGIILIVAGSATALVAGEFNLFSIITLCAGAAAAAAYAVVKRKEVAAAFTSRGARYGVNATVYTLLVIAIIVVIQAIFTVNTAQIDLTKNKKHTLADQTQNTLKNLKTEIEAYYFYSVTARNTAVEDLLKRYSVISPKFKTESIDADKNPAFARRFSVDRYGIVVFSRKDNGSFEKVDQLNEEGLTNALIRLAKGEKKKIYFTKGHAEPELDSPQNDKAGYSGLKAELGAYNYTVEQIELFSVSAVPADCSILVIAGPKTDIFDREAKVIKDYLRKGGKLLVFHSAFSNTPVLNSMLKEYGITARQDVIIDKLGRMFGGDVLMPIIASYDQHEITKTFRVATFFPVSRSLDMKTDITGIKAQALARTNQAAYGETDLEGIKKGVSSFDAKADHAGPLLVAAVVTADNSQFKPDADSNTVATTSKMVIFGSSEMANNSYLNASGNKDFVMNSFAFLSGDEDTISIRPRDNSFEPLFLSKIQGRLLFIIPVVFLPLLVIAVGVLVFVRRKMS
ncbi:MAG TPA: GldG family protein [Candidatus Goldiibacteriota bacterium]|nr:GldG family protein [Candidatus Goldiibacteriota bacterium]